MYTIKEAAARSGVGAPLIRAWERRYGVVHPVRTPAGYRLYDDAAIRLLVAMRTLTESGRTASEAARMIRVGDVDPGDLAAGARAARAEDGTAAVAANRERLIARFVAAATAASAPDTEAVLDEILATGSFEAVADDLLPAAAEALGGAWAEGRLSVAAEHAASAAVGRRLSAAFQAAGTAGRATVIVGLPPGSRHELGALAFAVALRRRGVGVLYLGPDVTVDGWVDAAGRTKPRAAVIGVVTGEDRTAAGEVVAALLAQGVPLVATGGAGASSPPAESEGAVRLPDRVSDAARDVAEAVGRRRP